MSVMLVDVDPGFWGRVKIALFGSIHFRYLWLGHGYAWTYLFRCPKCHKIVESYTHTHDEYLECPECDV